MLVFQVNNIAAGTANTAAGTASATFAAAPAVVGTGWTTNFATGGVTTTQEVTAANSKSGGTALGITYNFGMATVSYGTFTAKSGGDSDQKAKATIMGVSMPFGATTVGITSSNAQRTNAAATATVKVSGYRGKVSYALSKRTTAYAAYGAEKVEASTLADKQTAFGLTHSF
jgi:predicted porin